MLPRTEPTATVIANRALTPGGSTIISPGGDPRRSRTTLPAALGTCDQTYRTPSSQATTTWATRGAEETCCVSTWSIRPRSGVSGPPAGNSSRMRPSPRCTRSWGESFSWASTGRNPNATGRASIPAAEFEYYLAFNMFRLTAILQGIMARALQGNASSQEAVETGKRARPLAEEAWRQVEAIMAGKI